MLKLNLVCQLDLIKAADFITGFTSRHYRQHKANMNVHNIGTLYIQDGRSIMLLSSGAFFHGIMPFFHSSVHKKAMYVLNYERRA